MATKNPMALIWDAIAKADVAEVRRLFGAHPEWINAHIPYGGGTFLHLAAAISEARVVEAMLSVGFEIDKPGTLDGETAISAACAKGNCDTAKLLLEKGAVLDVSKSGRNALFSAIIGRSPEISVLLLDAGIDSTIRYTSETMTNMDAIAFALERGEAEIARIIAERNAAGDSEEVVRLLAEGNRIADENNRP